jgi:hypothetical protein
MLQSAPVQGYTDTVQEQNGMVIEEFYGLPLSRDIPPQYRDKNGMVIEGCYGLPLSRDIPLQYRDTNG